MTKYRGKKAVVVGGTTGVGLDIATRLAEGGAEVLLVGRDPDRLAAAAAELGSGGRAAAADLADLAAVRALGPLAAERLGRIDFLFANAGICLPAATEEVTEAHYDRQFAVNTKGIYFAVQTLLPLLAPGGAIVFTTSADGTAAAPGMGVHAMTKSALWSFAQALAGELADRGIRVNAVAPGLLDTPGCGVRGLSPEALAGFRELGHTAAPLGRRGTSGEVARAALFLAADATFTTGTRLAVDGGLARTWPRPDRT